MFRGAGAPAGGLGAVQRLSGHAPSYQLLTRCAHTYIQCLDDSTDPETRAVVDKGIEFWRGQGIKIEAIRRTNRQARGRMRARVGSGCARVRACGWAGGSERVGGLECWRSGS